MDAQIVDEGVFEEVLGNIHNTLTQARRQRGIFVHEDWRPTREALLDCMLWIGEDLGVFTRKMPEALRFFNTANGKEKLHLGIKRYCEILWDWIEACPLLKTNPPLGFEWIGRQYQNVVMLQAEKKGIRRLYKHLQSRSAKRIKLNGAPQSLANRVKDYDRAIIMAFNETRGASKNNILKLIFQYETDKSEKAKVAHRELDESEIHRSYKRIKEKENVMEFVQPMVMKDSPIQNRPRVQAIVGMIRTECSQTIEERKQRYTPKEDKALGKMVGIAN